jgi:hypothetical protein
MVAHGVLRLVLAPRKAGSRVHHRSSRSYPSSGSDLHYFRQFVHSRRNVFPLDKLPRATGPKTGTRPNIDARNKAPFSIFQEYFRMGTDGSPHIFGDRAGLVEADICDWTTGVPARCQSGNKFLFSRRLEVFQSCCHEMKMGHHREDNVSVAGCPNIDQTRSQRKRPTLDRMGFELVLSVMSET